MKGEHTGDLKSKVIKEVWRFAVILHVGDGHILSSFWLFFMVQKDHGTETHSNSLNIGFDGVNILCELQSLHCVDREV